MLGCVLVDPVAEPDAAVIAIPVISRNKKSPGHMMLRVFPNHLKNCRINNACTLYNKQSRRFSHISLLLTHRWHNPCFPGIFARPLPFDHQGSRSPPDPRTHLSPDTCHGRLQGQLLFFVGGGVCGQRLRHGKASCASLRLFLRGALFDFVAAGAALRGPLYPALAGRAAGGLRDAPVAGPPDHPRPGTRGRARGGANDLRRRILHAAVVVRGRRRLCGGR